MDFKYDISVVVPIYNVEKYLINCLESIDKQSYKNFELILVDDGSTDKSGSIVDKYAIGKDNTVVIHKQNGGLSSARNEGIKIAKGRYICFVDADDMVSDDYIETILEKTKEDWDFCYISWQGKSNKVIIRDTAPTWNCCVWNCVYKRDLIGDKRFDPKLKMAEDYDFNRKVRNGKKANIAKILYYYNEDTPNSLTKQGEMYNSKY